MWDRIKILGATMDNPAMQELPRYQCHKKVWALQIKAIEFKPPTISELEEILKENLNARPAVAIITPVEEGYAPFGIDQDYWERHLMRMKPEEIVGGYYVVYDDGYKSWSPALAFEDGYTRI